MAQAANESRSRLLGPARCIAGLSAFLLLCACCSVTRDFEPGFSRVSWSDSSVDIYVVDTRVSRISIYGRSSRDAQLGSFERLQQYLHAAGDKLDFATNGGMFHVNYDPVGLLVQDGVEQSPLNLSQGDGNFFLKPNGVFLITPDGKAAIVPSERYPRLRVGVSAATQSGPLLIVRGKINALFRAGSPNRLIRSGVGLIDPYTVVFAISNQPMNFWDFARLFRDEVKCKDALFLDGVISQFYLPNAQPLKAGKEFGVLIGVTKIS